MKPLVAAAMVGLFGLGTTGCEDDTITDVDDGVSDRDTVLVGDGELTFSQIDRLGNPLVSEVMLEKRLHELHNTTNPSTDVENFSDDLVGFVTDVAGRDQAYGEAIAGALLPDMLLVFPNRAPGVTAADADDSELVGWLTFALAPDNTGYGGRKLDNDDAVDKGLSVIFGEALGNTSNVSPGLITDNVSDDTQDPNTFPYVAEPF